MQPTVQAAFLLVVLAQLMADADAAKTPYDFRPVLVVTADATAEARRRALALGAKDFLTKPFDTLEAMLRVWNLLETRALYKRLQALTPKDPLAPQSYRGRRD